MPGHPFGRIIPDKVTILYYINQLQYYQVQEMRDSIQSLKSRIDTLKTELNAMLRMLGATMEKKDPKAWDWLHVVGRKLRNDAFI